MAWRSRVLGCGSWRPCLAALALLLCVGHLGDARAAEAPHDAKQEAKARFVAGQSHYNLNEFPEALREFKEAYRLYPDPVFLYNLGQCERQLGHLDEAIRFYRTFLREQPKAPNRQEVLKKIEEMEASLKAKPSEDDKGTAPPPAIEPPGPAKPGLPPPAPPVAPAVAPQPPMPAAPAPGEPKAAAAPSPLPLPATPPVTPEPAGGAPDQIDLSASPTPPAEASPAPFYKRWWFWTAAAAVVAVGTGVGIYAATANQSPSVPASILGSKKVF